MTPASLAVAETALEDVTRNRRDPAGSYNYDTRRFSAAYDPANPKNQVDPTLTVIRVDAAGKTMAVLFHFATHGTVLGPENLALSADWQGVAQARIEAALGVPALYLNGAQGDQAPAMLEDDHTDLQWMDIIGTKVADGVLTIVSQAQPVAATPVRAVMERVDAPPGDNLMGKKVPKALVKHYFGELPLQAVRLGDVTLMALPVEAVTEVGQAMREGARGQGARCPLVVGLANDHLLYTASPDDFAEGGYEVEMTALGLIEPALLIGEEMLLVRRLLRP
jgi:hypothetical protein